MQISSRLEYLPTKMFVRSVAGSKSIIECGTTPVAIDNRQVHDQSGSNPKQTGWFVPIYLQSKKLSSDLSEEFGQPSMTIATATIRCKRESNTHSALADISHTSTIRSYSLQLHTNLNPFCNIFLSKISCAKATAPLNK